tara:strand:+ start:20812 stop:21396 length:585 start_codon:yes stop_codon:yes gene_type:complete
MKISEVIIVEDVNELVRQELEDKIGPINKRRPGWENVNTPLILSTAKGYATTGGPSMTPGLAVDLAIEEVHPEFKDKMKAKFGYKRDKPGVDNDRLKTSFDGGNSSDDSRNRQDAIGRNLKHDRYYGTDEPEDLGKRVGIAKRFKDVDSIRKTKSPTKFAKAAAGTLRDLERSVSKVRALAPQTQKGVNFKKNY